MYSCMSVCMDVCACQERGWVVGHGCVIIGVCWSLHHFAESFNFVTLGDSSRVVGLVQLLLKFNAADCLVEDYAACLELRSEESQIIENRADDPGVLIMQVCLAPTLLKN